MAETIIHTTGRNNCGGRCLLHAHVENGRIVRMTTDSPEAAGDGVPLTACVRCLSYADTVLTGDRLQYPLKRVGRRGEGKFERIGWDEAVDIIAREWARIRDQYSPASRYVNYATGVSALLRGNELAKRLLSLDGGFLDYYNSYSSAATGKATALVYGTAQTGSSLDNWLDAKLIVLWGHNPAATKFDSQTMFYLRKAKDAGVPIVVIDPRETETVRELGAYHIPIRPAADAALCDAIAYVLYTEALHDQAFLDRCCIGFDEAHLPDGVPAGESVVSYLLGAKDGIKKTPEWAEAITGVPAATTRRLARAMATLRPSAQISGWGPQRHVCGEQSVRGTILLACMTGSVGVRGGWAGGAAYFSRHREPELPMPENPVKTKIPVYLWTDAVERGRELTSLDGVTGGDSLDSEIKMIVNLAGSCLLNQHGDINRTAALLRDETKCEFIVCSDLFLTPSAKFADILLPGISMLECDNITSPWIYGDFIGFGSKVIEPVGEGRFEYDWLCEVADRLGLRPAFSEGRTAGQWLEHCYCELRRHETELPDFDTFRAAGVCRYQNNPPHTAFEDECRDPGTHPFPTESGKIELFSRRVYETEFRSFFPPIPRYCAVPEGPDDPLRERYPLQLTGYHTVRRCHSIHDNNKRLHALDPQALWIHPEDAAARGLCDGDMALVFNDRGKMKLPVFVTGRVMPGVTALSQGAWYDPDENGIDRAGSINVLTSRRTTPYARGNGQHTNLVQVEKV